MKKLVTFVLLMFFLGGLVLSAIPGIAHANGDGAPPIPETNPEPPPPPDD